MPLPLGNIVRLSIDPVGGYALVTAVAVTLVSLLLLGPARGKATTRRRRLLSALRLGAVVMVVLAMLRPTIVWTTITKQPATLILLLDRSRSMQVTDTVGGKSRWLALRSVLEEALPALNELDKDLDVKVYTFDAEAQRLDFSTGTLKLEEQPDGEQTAIGAVLDDMLSREAGQRIAAVVLLSDGAQRAYTAKDIAPHLPASRLADMGYPLHTVPFGQARGPGQARDVALEELLTSGTVFVKNQLEVAGTARVEGYVNQNVPVQLLVETSPGKMEAVDTSRFEAKRDGDRPSIHLEYVPQVPGEIKITLKADVQPRELVTTNNEISTFVTVRKGGLNVLYLNGSLLAEQKFLRWALEASPDIKVDYFYLQPQQPDTKPPDLAERFQPGKYDVYMIGDLDSQAFTEEELTQLAAAVEGGAGFVMLGGLHSFGAGGYGQTPLADVLPIEIDRLERQNFGENIREDLHLSGDLQLRPTRFGAAQSLMLLAARDQNEAAWADLPPLEGANRFSGVKTGAAVLAETQSGSPLLVAREFGGGRVIAFAPYSTWHWWMEGHEAAHRRFWRQVILWLARKDESTEGNVWIKLAERRYGRGMRVQFTAGAETAEGEPITDAVFEAEVIPPGKQPQPLSLASGGAEVSGSFRDTQAAGDYTLVVTATRDSQPIGTARARFLVYEQDLELSNPAADLGLLESLAAMTSGKSVAPEQLPKLLAEIQEATRQLDVETQVTRSLWDTWPFFVILISLLILEWYLRKKWGLV